MMGLGLQIIPSLPLMPQAIEVAVRIQQAVYDCVYLTLAAGGLFMPPCTSLTTCQKWPAVNSTTRDTTDNPKYGCPLMPVSHCPPEGNLCQMGTARQRAISPSPRINPIQGCPHLALSRCNPLCPFGAYSL